MNNFKDIFKGKTDEEIMAMANKFYQEEVTNEAIDETTSLNLIGSCSKLVQKLSSVPLIGALAVDIEYMIRLLYDLTHGNYTIGNAWKKFEIISKLTIALAYFVAPVDLIPDNVPIVGYIDDIYVIRSCIALIQDELNLYKAHVINKQYDDFRNELFKEYNKRAENTFRNSFTVVDNPEDFYKDEIAI